MRSQAAQPSGPSQVTTNSPRPCAASSGSTLAAHALSAYLQLGSVPAPLTVYENVVSLLPGHYAHVSLRPSLSVTTHGYWSWPRPGSTQASELRRALAQAVRSHLVRLCGASQWVTEQIADSPAVLDALIDQRTLYEPPGREAMKAENTSQ